MSLLSALIDQVVKAVIWILEMIGHVIAESLTVCCAVIVVVSLYRIPELSDAFGKEKWSRRSETAAIAFKVIADCVVFPFWLMAFFSWRGPEVCKAMREKSIKRMTLEVEVMSIFFHLLNDILVVSCLISPFITWNHEKAREMLCGSPLSSASCWDSFDKASAIDAFGTSRYVHG